MNIFLVKNGNEVLVFYSETEMKTAGYKADKIVTDEEFNSNGCYTRIINGEIVVGKTDEEKRIQEINDQIQEIDSDLESLDKQYLTPRILKGLAENDEYAFIAAATHEAKAIPLRNQRETLKSELDVLCAS